ncbi:unknown protein [Oryza sativa Japonica Group]|uniref:Uncharacterized protein n=1 Tax=Oryza sativa subsp. japonica TaxID=39947 RepID=Q5JJZ4_ORYSJ|nr:unknown protein [Oryza sativa Japonica Group]
MPPNYPSDPPSSHRAGLTGGYGKAHRWRHRRSPPPLFPPLSPRMALGAWDGRAAHEGRRGGRVGATGRRTTAAVAWYTTAGTAHGSGAGSPVCKGMEELGNITKLEKQRHHVIGQYVVGQKWTGA